MNIHGRRIVSPHILRLSSWCTLKYNCGCGSFSVTNDAENYGNKIHNIQKKSHHDSVSSLDSFTDNLVEERLKKWELSLQYLCKKKGFKREEYDELKDQKTLPSSMSSMKNVDSAASEISSNRDYVEEVLKNCTEKDSFSEQKTWLALLQISAKHGDKQSIHFIKNFSETKNPNFCELQGNYDHYLAEAIWRSGNVEEALQLFWEVYEQNITLRVKVKVMIKILMAESIYGKGEAVLVLLMKFAKKFSDVYCDYSLLSYIWEVCFLSDWFSDIEIASSLLEKYPELRSYLSVRVFHISSFALAIHKVDVVHRLCEVMLKYGMMKEYEIVMRSFFDYACVHRDFAACAAIIDSCKELNVSLTEAQQTKYLVLICDTDTPFQTKPIQTPKFKF